MKNKHCDTPFLPPELIKEILLRLPVKSLLRFKGICRSWLSLISDPQFGVSHHDLAAPISHRLLFPSDYPYFQSIDIDADLSVLLHFRLPTPPNEIQPVPDIVGSCRGFLLLYCATTRDLILWNPSIGVHKRFSSFQHRLTRDFLYGFGYDVSTDDYLIILIEPDDIKTEIQVYSFKTNSRNTICIDVPYISLGRRFHAGWLFNDTLYWLVFSLDSRVCVVIAFDLIQRSLSEIPLFKGRRLWLSVREMGGCLAVCCTSMSRAETEIWVMKEYKMQSSWTKYSVFLTHRRNVFYPICSTKDGGILGSDSRNFLEKLDDKGERLEHVTFHSSRTLFLENLHFALYRESLLSLPSYEAPTPSKPGRIGSDTTQHGDTGRHALTCLRWMREFGHIPHDQRAILFAQFCFYRVSLQPTSEGDQH